MKETDKTKESRYEYSTAQIAKFYGLTAKGLAYYEDQGLIAPQRQAGSGYRVYTLDDCYGMYHAKLYKNAGFSLKETADLLREEDLDQIVTALERRASEEQRAIRLRQRMVAHVELINEMLRRYQQEGVFYDLVQRPPFYRLYVRNFDWAHVASNAQARCFMKWNESIPVDSASLLYEEQALQSGAEKLNVNIANVIEAKDMELLALPMGDEVSFLPSVWCIQTILVGRSDQINQIGWLKPGLSYLKEHHLMLDGPVLTRMLMVTGRGAERMRYDLAWFPIVPTAT